MTTIGNLLIKLGADVASLRTDMDRARGVVSGAMADIERHAKLARNALGGFAATFALLETAGTLARLVNGVAEVQSKLHDLSLTTGISVETLSALQDVGRLSGVEIESLSAATVKLAKNMASVDEDSKGAAQAVRALGLDFDSFKRLQADQQMLSVAQAMDNYRDSNKKAAAAQLLFGKEGARLIPFLKDLAQQHELVASVTGQGASAADDYLDNLTKLDIQFQKLKRDALTPVIGELADVTRRFVEAEGAGNKLSLAVKMIYDNMRNTRMPGGLWNIFADDPVTSRLSKEIGKSASPLGRSSALSSWVLPEVKVQTSDEIAQQKKAAEAAKKSAEEYTKLIAKVRERNQVEEFEATIGRKLVDGEKTALEIMSELRDGVLTLTDARKLALGAELEAQITKDKARAEDQRTLKWLEETGDENVKAIETAMAQADAYRDQAKEARLLNDTYGMSQEQLQALESRRLSDVAAVLEQRAGYHLATDAGRALAQVELDQAAAVRELVKQRQALAQQQELDRTDPLRGARLGVKDYLREIESAGDATRNAVQRGAGMLEDTLVDTFATGKLNVTSFIDYTIREFLRLQVVRPLMQDLLGGSGGGLFSLFGGGGGGGAGMPTDAGITPTLDVASAGSGAALGGMAKTTVVYSPTISIDSRTDVAQVSALVREGVTQGQRQLLDDLRAAGKV